MGKYTGSQCIVCQKLFEENDNIVVCPDCGTPYHRSCYQSVARCINTPLHAVGGSWQAQQQETRRNLGGRVCSGCQFVNAPDALSCASCGRSLQPEQRASTVRIQMPDGQNVYFDAADPCCGASPEEPVEEERLGDVASYVDRNTLYYIPLFRRFRDTGRKLSLNLTCLLFPYCYFSYRKMWPMALFSILLSILCGLPYSMLSMLTTLTSKEYAELLQQFYDPSTIHMFDGLTAFLQNHEAFLQSLSVPMYLISLGVRIIFCLSANYLYYRHVLKSTARIRKNASSDKVRSALLHAEGGASLWNVVGCFALYYALNIMVYVALTVILL